MKSPEDLFELYMQAAATKNAAMMVGMYHQNAQLFDMWNAYQLSGIDAIRNMVSGWFNSLGDEQVKVEFSEVQLSQGDEVAFASAFVHFRAVDSAGMILRQMKNRMTVGFVKTNDSWHVLHQHTSIPISTANLQGIFE